MIPLEVQTLIMSHTPTPSVLVLKPVEPIDETRRNSRVVPIWIGLPEAAQIGLALDHIKLPRPLTHDLLLDILTNLDSYVDQVVIYGMKDSTYFSKIVIKHHNRTVEVDARPSDAITLALKQDAPIYINEELLDEISYPFIVAPDVNEDIEIKDFHNFVKNIIPDDFQ